MYIIDETIIIWTGTMGFVERWFTKKPCDVKAEDIESFISRKIEENINLDYKDIRSYSNYDELSKDISAFANSEGGLIILGVSEERIGKGKQIRIHPKEITWSDATLSKEQLEDNLIVKIRPLINGLRIIPIRQGNGSLKVIFLIDIPQSDNPPHMASDYRYYKRLNFERKPMEHYEVANFFKISWTMKEKLIEEIFIPLSSILGNQIKKLEKYNCPFDQEFEEVLSKTYYKMHMPWELFEYLDYYIDQIKNLRKLEYFSNKEIRTIINKNIVKYLKIEPIIGLIDELHFRFKAIYNKSGIDLYPNLFFELLLTNKKLKDFLIKEYYQHVFNKISIEFSNKTHDINIDDFEENIWEKCLKELSENQNIIKMKKKTEELLNIAWDLLDKITSY